MKFILLGFIALLCMSASHIPSIKTDPIRLNPEINTFMEAKYQLRDDFKEKGNSGKYLRISPRRFQ